MVVLGGGALSYGRGIPVMVTLGFRLWLPDLIQTLHTVNPPSHQSHDVSLTTANCHTTVLGP